MQLTLLKGYPDRVGKRFIFCGSGKGPTSYVNTATYATSGDSVQGLPFENYVDAIAPAVSLSGTYIVYFVPTTVGARATFKAHWYTLSSATEVTNAVNLSAESIQIMGYGGVY